MDDELDFLWSIITTFEEFEVIAYLIVSNEDSESTWYLTPKTRDNQRDAEGYSYKGINFYEAKFLSSPSKKLQLTRIGTNILIAICSHAKKVYIFTNGNLARNIINFQNNQNSIAGTEIIFYDRKQTSIALIRYSSLNIWQSVIQLDYIKYRTLSKEKLDLYKEIAQTKARNIISKIVEFKEKNKDSFYLNPTIENYRKIANKKLLQEINETYFKFSIEFDGPGVSVWVGKPFIVYIILSNYFDADLCCNLEISTTNESNKLLISAPNRTTRNNKFLISAEILRLRNVIIPISCQFLDSDYAGLDISFTINHIKEELFSSTKRITTEIDVSNKYFYTSYTGIQNQAILRDLLISISKACIANKYAAFLIKGFAGVGKSRLIEEIVGNLDFDIATLQCEIGADDFSSIFKKIFNFTLGIDYNSFLNSFDESLEKEIISSVSYIFDTIEERRDFIVQLQLLMNDTFTCFNPLTLKKYATFIGKLLIKFNRKPSILIFEDLHRGRLDEYHFLLALNDYLSTYSKEVPIIMIMAARSYKKNNCKIANEQANSIEIDAPGIHYDYFEARLKNVKIIELENLESSESLNMIHNILYENRAETRIIQRIVNICGNNPFGIIHTLIHLYTLSVIVPCKGKYQIQQANRLDWLNHISVGITEIFNERFNYYKKSEYAICIFKIIHILVICKAKIEYSLLRELIKEEQNFDQAFKLLNEERIIVYEQGEVKFEHENLFIYASNSLMVNSAETADKVYLYFNSQLENDKERIVRALFWSSKQYKNIFFKKAKEYFDSLRNQDLWREAIFYGNLILKKNEIAPNKIDLLEVKMNMFIMQSECGDIMTALHALHCLLVEMRTDLDDYKKKSDFITYYNLYLEVWLQTSDVMLHATQIQAAKESFLSLEYEISIHTILDFNRKHALLAWIYNRLAVIEMKNQDLSSTLQKLRIGLKHAQKANATYYIHHCYYDMSIAYLLSGNNRLMSYYCSKSKMDILKNNRYKNASIRTNIHESLVLFFKNKISAAIQILRRAVDTALFYSYYHEANRGLLYLSSIYLYVCDFEQSRLFIERGIQFVEIDKAAKLQIGIYSNYIFYNYQKYIAGDLKSLEAAKEYYLKAINILFDDKGPKRPINNWLEMAISNFQVFDNYLCSSLSNFEYASYIQGNELPLLNLKNYQTTINLNLKWLDINFNQKAGDLMSPYYAIFS